MRFGGEKIPMTGNFCGKVDKIFLKNIGEMTKKSLFLCKNLSLASRTSEKLDAEMQLRIHLETIN